MNANVILVFDSTVSNLEALMDACFPRQHKAHVEAYLAHQDKLSRAARNAAIDSHMLAAVAAMNGN